MDNNQSNSIQESLRALSVDTGESKEEKLTSGLIDFDITEEKIRARLLKDMDGDPLRLTKNCEEVKDWIGLKFKNHQRVNAFLPEESRQDANNYNQAETDALYQLLKKIHYEVTSKVKIKILELPPPPAPNNAKQWSTIVYVFEGILVVISISILLYALNWLFDSEPLSQGLAFLKAFKVVGLIVAAVSLMVFALSVQKDAENLLEKENDEFKKAATEYRKWLDLKEEIELRQKMEKIRD